MTGICLNSYAISFLSDLNGYTISRCFIPTCLYTGSPTPYLSNIILKENCIGNLAMGNTFFSGFYLSNNIFTDFVNSPINSIIRNNVFLDDSYPYFNNSLVENNLFRLFSIGINNYNSIFHNNVNGGINGASNGGNQGSGNYLNQEALSSFFVNYDPATITLSNIYQADFHLVPGSPLINAGRDGTDIGIYGGTYPWKDGSIPFNPHVQSINISPVTNSSGNLDVNIQVEAQDR